MGVPKQPVWGADDLVLAGMGDCPGDIKTIVGCLTPDGGVKMRATFSVLYKWIKEARRRCGKVAR